jgi:CheY-like chemotaxis protein
MRKRPLVLVVDDEVVYCDVIRLVLEAYGVDVLTAHNANQALNALEDVKPDMFIVDMMMPDIDGLQFVQRLRDDPVLGAEPILIASAKAMPADRQAALEAGASHFLSKPFTAKQLRDILRTYLPLPTTGELRTPWRGNGPKPNPRGI